MAATYTYSDILTIVSKSLPRAFEDNFSSLACNMATNLIWVAYDWREAMATLPPFHLIPNEQDHKTPPITVPTDFQGFRKVELCRYTDGAIAKYPMTVVKDLQLTHIKAPPTSISYEPSATAFRVHPRVPDSMGAPFWFIEGTYKKKPTKITNATLDTTFPFDDLYLNTAVECLRWAVMACSNDPRTGTVQMNGSQVVYSGQLAIAKSAIDAMATHEGFNEGDVQIAPASSLVPGNLGYVSQYPALFGF